MNEDTEQPVPAKPLILFTPDLVDGAREMVLSVYDTAKLAHEKLIEADVKPIEAEMLAYASLFLATCRELKVPLVVALQAAEELLGSKPPSSIAIH